MDFSGEPFPADFAEEGRGGSIHVPSFCAARRRHAVDDENANRTRQKHPPNQQRRGSRRLLPPRRKRPRIDHADRPPPGRPHGGRTRRSALGSHGRRKPVIDKLANIGCLAGCTGRVEFGKATYEGRGRNARITAFHPIPTTAPLPSPAPDMPSGEAKPATGRNEQNPQVLGLRGRQGLRKGGREMGGSQSHPPRPRNRDAEGQPLGATRITKAKSTTGSTSRSSTRRLGPPRRRCSNGTPAKAAGPSAPSSAGFSRASSNAVPAGAR